MARPSIEAIVAEKVGKYIEESLGLPYGTMPLSTLAASNAIGHDRRVLKKYGQDAVIAAAEKLAIRNAKSKQNSKRRTLEERLDAAQQETQRLGAQNNSLIAQLAVVEGNAKRLGIDPEELYKALTPPDRRVANVFRGRGKRRDGRY